MASAGLLARGVRAEEALPIPPAGPFLSAEKTKRFLMGREIAPTDIWFFRTEGKLPVLRAKQGQEYRLRFNNKLEEEIWLHLFGVRGGYEMMTVPVQPGDANATDIVFTPPDAGTFWFGPLVNASRQRDMGLSGMLIVEEANPPVAFADVPLIFDDWILDDQGKMDQSFGNLEAAIGRGRPGNWFTVNGTYRPQYAVERSKPTRLRLLNVCNSRTLTLQLRNVDVLIIAEDGQPVTPRPPGLDPLTLAPGQRLDMLVVTILDQAIISLDLGQDVVEAVYLMGQGEAGAALQDDFRLPDNPLPAVPAGEPRVVPLLLAGGENGGLKSARVGELTLELRQLLEKGLAWSMNGVAGLGGPFIFEARKGEAIALDVQNTTAFPQPLNIHGHVWKVVERDGQPVEGEGWGDTAVIPEKSRAKLLLVADNPGPWAIQSLIAERSDAGLIGAFRVAEA
ncbi:multicopper oxidase family protein [Aestuariivirga sp.]|uniref:multicopper oxidase family protein n=1 Tax=Aestuariivirga sp. TaxID=2650926 RepID=UPI0039E22F92